MSFFGGIGSVGGNCILIEHGEHRIMLDNGMNFPSEGRYYKDFLMPRAGNDLRDYLTLDLVPKIPGIYAKAMISDLCIDSMDPSMQYMYDASLQSYEDYLEEHGRPFIDGFFITHAHVDHVRNLQFMAPQIPTFMSELTKKMLEVMGEVSRIDFLRLHPSTLAEYGGMSYFPGTIKKARNSIERDIYVVHPGESRILGDITVTGFPVDHSIPGALAFRVEAGGKTIIYTGDIRFHGVEQESTNSFHFVEMMEKMGTNDILITEGTRIRLEEGESEQSVYERALGFLNARDGQDNAFIFASFPWKSIARFLTVYRLARNVGRTLVIQPKLAYLLHKIRKSAILMGINILRNEDIRIYQPRKLSMLYSDGDYIFKKEIISPDSNWDKTTRDYIFYRDLYGDSKHVRAPEIHHSPGKFIVHLDYYDLNELIDLDPRSAGGCFLHLKTEPFDEEMEISQSILENWIEKFNLQMEIFHASGHASGPDLIAMIHKIRPDVIFPVHTEHPDLFQEKLGENFRVMSEIQEGKKYLV